MNVGSVYSITVRRKRGTPQEYRGIYLGHSKDSLYFSLTDQPGVRLSVEESYILDSTEISEGPQPMSSSP
jgi:hypothetical protein